jgi:hypothetical protein
MKYLALVATVLMVASLSARAEDLAGAGELAMPTCAKFDKPGATAKDLPDEVQPFVLDKVKEEVLWLYCADLNGDGRPDYLLVTALATRYFQILIRQPDGKLQSVIRSENVLHPSPNGPGADMDGLSVQKMGFTVTNSDVYGAGGTGRVTVFRFRYSPKDKTWVLSRVSRGDWGPPTGAPDDSFEKTARDFGHVTISAFDYRDFDHN